MLFYAVLPACRIVLLLLVGSEEEMNELDQRRKEVADSLNSLPDSPLGTELFNAVARKSVTIAFEAVLFRVKAGKTEVYLTRRPPGEAYEGQWHCPGSAFRPGERPMDVANRLSEREFGRQIGTFTYCDDFFYEEERGWYLSKVFFIECSEEPTVTEDAGWSSVDNLPEPLVEHHRTHVIPIALKAYQG